MSNKKYQVDYVGMTTTSVEQRFKEYKQYQKDSMHQYDSE
jgi:hypothetical protein